MSQDGTEQPEVTLNVGVEDPAVAIPDEASGMFTGQYDFEATFPRETDDTDAEQATEGITGQDDEGDDTGQADEEESTEDQPVDEHPDNFSGLDLPTQAEKEAWVRQQAEKNPQALLRGLLRQRDYTEKTTHNAREKERIAAEREQFEAERTQFQASRQPQPHTATSPTQQVPGMLTPVEVAEIQQWAQQFYAQAGREPTQLELQNYLAVRANSQVKDAVLQEVTPVVARHEADVLQAEFNRQWAQIEKELPFTTTPGVRDNVEQRLVAEFKAGLRTDIKPGDLVGVVAGLHPQEYAEAVTAPRQAARAKQAARRAGNPPPEAQVIVDSAKALEEELTTAPTNSLDEIAARQKRDPAKMAMLGIR